MYLSDRFFGQVPCKVFVNHLNFIIRGFDSVLSNVRSSYLVVSTEKKIISQV